MLKYMTGPFISALNNFPCARVQVIGHSLGGVMAELFVSLRTLGVFQAVDERLAIFVFCLRMGLLGVFLAATLYVRALRLVPHHESSGSRARFVSLIAKPFGNGLVNRRGLARLIR